MYCFNLFTFYLFEEHYIKYCIIDICNILCNIFFLYMKVVGFYNLRHYSIKSSEDNY